MPCWSANPSRRGSGYGIPAALAVTAAWVLTWLMVRAEVRRWLLFAALFLAGLSLLGALDNTHLLIVAPWFFLPLAVALGKPERPFLSRFLVLALVVAAGVGWYGIYNRRLYASPRFLAPWPAIASEAASALNDGSGVVANNPTFFLYLTYVLQPPPGGTGPAGGPAWRFFGSLPDGVRIEGIWSADQWLAAGRPLRSSTPLPLRPSLSPSFGSAPLFRGSAAAAPPCPRTRRRNGG